MTLVFSLVSVLATRRGVPEKMSNNNDMTDIISFVLKPAVQIPNGWVNGLRF